MNTCVMRVCVPDGLCWHTCILNMRQYTKSMCRYLHIYVHCDQLTRRSQLSTFSQLPPPPNHHHHLSFITGSLPWFTQVGSCDKSSIHPTHHGTTSTLSAHSLQINPVIKLCNGQIRFNVIPRLTHNLRDFHRLERVPKQTSSVSTTKRISLTLSFS